MSDENTTRETLLGAELNKADEGGKAPEGDDKGKAPEVDDKGKANEGGDKGKANEGDDKGDDKGETDEPIVYEFKSPEDMPLDEDMLGRLKETCTKLKVPKEEAQALLDLGVELVRKNAAAAHDEWNRTLDGWESEIKSHPKLGGEKLSASMAVAARPLARFGNEALRKLVTETGIGSNPAFFEFMHAVGTAMADDNPPAGDKSSSGAGDLGSKDALAAALFPTTTPKK